MSMQSHIHHTLILHGQEVMYTIRTSTRARSLRLTIRPDTTITVTLPRGVSKQAGVRFIHSHLDWVAQKVAQLARQPVRTALQGDRSEYLKHKKQARELVLTRLDHFNQFYGLHWKRVSIRNQSSRWGSCSRKGNLSFHYKIALLPPELADYLVVHELCHLKEFNHSARFWALVEKSIPEYKSKRTALKEVLTKKVA